MDDHLQEAWRSAVEAVEGHQEAVLLGRHFRIHVAKALSAAYATAKVVLSGGKIATGNVDLPSVLGLLPQAFAAVVAVLAAVQEPLKPGVYLACLVLSSKDAMTEEQFRAAYGEFLASDRHAELPWYLRISADKVRDARSEWADGAISAALLDKLVELGLAQRDGDRVRFHDREVDWGFAG